MGAGKYLNKKATGSELPVAGFVSTTGF